jgi:hypothetical protein
MNCCFIDNTVKTCCLEVYIYTDISKMYTYMNSKGFESYEYGTTLFKQNVSSIFFHLDTKSIYTSMMEIGKNLSCVEEDFCVNVMNVLPEFKVAICKNILKYCCRIHNHQVLMVRDKRKYKGKLVDILNETASCYVARDLKFMNGKQCIQKVKTLFSKDNTIDVVSTSSYTAVKYEGEHGCYDETICLIGDVDICGILKYFTRYQKKIYIRVIGLIPYNKESILDLVSIASQSYKATHIYVFDEQDSTKPFPGELCTIVSSTSMRLSSKIKSIGDFIGERVRVNEKMIPQVQNVRYTTYIDIVNNKNFAQHSLGNGVSLGINIVKTIIRENRRKYINHKSISKRTGL